MADVTSPGAREKQLEAQIKSADMVRSHYIQYRGTQKLTFYGNRRMSFRKK